MAQELGLPIKKIEVRAEMNAAKLHIVIFKLAVYSAALLFSLFRFALAELCPS